jgi:hypothetical protein
MSTTIFVNASVATDERSAPSTTRSNVGCGGGTSPICRSVSFTSSSI